MGSKEMTQSRIQELTQRGVERLRGLASYEVARIPATSLNPSQPDDGLPSLSALGEPVMVADVDGNPTIVDGNHRYYQRLRLIQPDSVPYIKVVKVENPYTEY